LGNYVAMLEEFVSSRGLEKVVLVGNCMGCAISLAFTERHPDRVKALVLCNPLTEATFLGGWLGPLLWLRERLPGINRQVYRVLGHLKLTNGIGSVASLFQLGPRGRALNVHRRPDIVEPYAATGQLESLLGVLDDLENYSVIDNLAPPPGFPPICTIWGMKNKIVSPKAGVRLNSTLHPARQEWLPGSGHLLMLEQPDEVASIIDEFLDSAAVTNA
jgi:pimeloyl-ACP methyl ester carboxylesterase